MLPEPEQERQEEAHATHVATVPTTLEKVPLLGHSATQVPSARKGVLAEVQLRQSEVPGPEHVPHAASQGWQTLLLSANLATGRHDARQAPGASK